MCIREVSIVERRVPVHAVRDDERHFPERLMLNDVCG